MQVRVHYIDDSSIFLRKVEVKLKRSKVRLNNRRIVFSFEAFDAVESYTDYLDCGEALKPKVILIDMSMHGDRHAGVKLAEIARSKFPDAFIIMLTHFNDAKVISDSMAAGADNFIAKSEIETLDQAIADTIKLSQVAHKNEKRSYAGYTLQSIADKVPKILGSALRAVFIYGETGTGKELVADMFRKEIGVSKPFVVVNCGAISPNLIESELFGHKKGSFTGASSDHIGYFEQANGGWLYLDEISLLPDHAQRAMLRAIENQQIIRVGETKPRNINVKIISASNEMLSEGVKKGIFRQDLWQRLAETTIKIPPLRERKEEIAEIVNYFASEMEGGPYTVPLTTIKVLQKYKWSEGNVRELRNTLRAMTMNQVQGGVLWPKCIPENIYDSVQEYYTTINEFEDVRGRPKGIKVQYDDGESKEEKILPLKIQSDEFSYKALEEALFIATLKTFRKGPDKINMSQFQKATGIAKATVSRRINDLVKEGKIEKELFDLGKVGRKRVSSSANK